MISSVSGKSCIVLSAAAEGAGIRQPDFAQQNPSIGPEKQKSSSNDTFHLVDWNSTLE